MSKTRKKYNVPQRALLPAAVAGSNISSGINKTKVVAKPKVVTKKLLLGDKVAVPDEFKNIEINPKVYTVWLANYKVSSPNEMSAFMYMEPTFEQDEDDEDVEELVGYNIIGFHAAAQGSSAAVETSGELTGKITQYFVDNFGNPPNIQAHTHPNSIGGSFSGTDLRDHEGWLDMRFKKAGQIHFAIMHNDGSIICRTYRWYDNTGDPEKDGLEYFEWRPNIHKVPLKPEATYTAAYNHRWDDGGWGGYYGAGKGYRKNGHVTTQQHKLPSSPKDRFRTWEHKTPAPWDSGPVEEIFKAARALAKRSDFGSQSSVYPTMVLEKTPPGQSSDQHYLSPLGLQGMPDDYTIQRFTKGDWSNIANAQSLVLDDGRHILQTGYYESDAAVLRWFEPLMRHFETDTLRHMYDAIMKALSESDDDNHASLAYVLSDELLWIEEFNLHPADVFNRRRDNEELYEGACAFAGVPFDEEE